MFLRLLIAALIIAALVMLMRRLRVSPLAARKAGGGSGRQRRRKSAMGRAEALQVLGLSGEADRRAVLAAHRRLLQKLHPDHGGSDYLAQRINEARDTLLESDEDR